MTWSAPERLALAALLHGGPRPRRDGYRVLELGCGNAANLIPLAYYRRHAMFVGIDSAATAIALANARKAELALSNIELLCCDFAEANERLTGELKFDFILAHGVLSWVSDDVRDRLLQLCARRLRPGGLLYLDYNARPGWNVRGLVRDFLSAQTANLGPLGERTRAAREIAARAAEALTADAEHPFVRLMHGEFRVVCDSNPRYVAHEYLNPHNTPYWRSEFLALARAHGLDYVADADFNLRSGRIPAGLPELIEKARLGGPLLDDTLDLFSYRQFHSPIFTGAPYTPRPAGADEWASLVLAACLEPLPPPDIPPEPGLAPARLFRHPSGLEIGARNPRICSALERLRPLWPHGLRVGELFDDVAAVVEDLRWLHVQEAVALRFSEADPAGLPAGPAESLNRLERVWDGYATGPDHTWAKTG